MTATKKATPVFLLLAIVAVILMFNYKDLPLSGHAKEAHQGQAWTPAKIKQYFADGKCTPQIDICEDDSEVHWCEISETYSIGLLIGKTIVQGITGYMARTEYWANKCGGAT